MVAIKRSKSEKIFDKFNIMLMFLISIVMLYGFWNQIMVSISDPQLALSGGLFLLPKGLNFGAYKTVFTSPNIWQGYMNTLIVTITGTVLGVLITALFAYPLSRKSLPARRLINFLVVFTMLFNGGMIPTFLVVKATGLLNSRWALIIPGLISGFNVIIMRNFFSNIPESLEESARIDGASDFTIFFRIILPLSKPVMATVALWVSVHHWNDFFHALIYLRDRALFPLQMILREIINATSPDEILEMNEDDLYVVPETIKAASIMVATVPILCVYPFIQKYFVKGVMLGSVKG